MKSRTVGLLVALTLSAGYVDAVAFFGLGVFTANMTGNTVLLGGAIAARILGKTHLPGGIGIALPLISIAAFVAGALVAAAVVRDEVKRPPLRSAALLAFVVALFAGVYAIYRVSPHALITPAVALLSVAMGVQSVVALRAGVPGVSTTYVTGTLLTAVMDLEEAKRREPAEGRTNAAIWACYLIGAAAGTLALYRLGANAFWVPAALVALSTLAL